MLPKLSLGCHIWERNAWTQIWPNLRNYDWLVKGNINAGEYLPSNLLSWFSAVLSGEHRMSLPDTCNKLKIFWGPQEEMNRCKSIDIVGNIWWQILALPLLPSTGLSSSILRFLMKNFSKADLKETTCHM